jgi:HAMP domain-containing protein
VQNPQRLIVLAGIVLAAGLMVWAVQARDTEQLDSFARCAADGNPVTDTNPPVCNAEAHTFLGPRQVLSASAAPGASLSSINFQLLVQGDAGGAYPKAQQVINNEAQWQRFWASVHAALPSAPPLLPVDFSGSNVVAITEGPQQTDGYNLKITAVSTSESGTVIDFTESIPTVTCQVTNRQSNRYFIARTPQLKEPVSFRLTRSFRHCGASPYLDNLN